MTTLMNGFLPEIGYALCGLIAVAIDVGISRKATRETRAFVALMLARLGAATALAGALMHHEIIGASADYFAVDALATANRVGVALLSWLVFEHASFARSHAKPAEAVALALFAACGLSLLGAAQHLLSGFLSLELAGLSLYALAGLDRRRAQASEAALKYFLFGGLAAAFLLFGFSYLYGTTGHFGFEAIRTSLLDQRGGGLVLVAVAFLCVGVAYKLAAAPFHAWAPDVYEAVHSFPVGLISSVSKVAGVTFFLRLFCVALEPVAGGSGSSGWVVGLALLSGTSLVLGNVVALAQTNLRRLLAYSAIGHSGALLLGLIVARTSGPSAVVYYVITYGLATVTLFGAIGILEDAVGEPLTLSSLKGLSKRSPFLAFAMSVSLLSLAGIPPLAGFFGKFFVFVGAFRIGGLLSVSGLLAALALAMSAVGLFYYLRVLKAMWIEKADPMPVVDIPLVARASFGFSVALLLVLGLKPDLLTGLFP